MNIVITLSPRERDKMTISIPKTPIEVQDIDDSLNCVFKQILSFSSYTAAI